MIFRFFAWLIVGLALMLLGADIISAIEDEAVDFRTMSELFGLFGLNAGGWVEAAPGGARAALDALMKVPGWAVFGVVGVLLALLFRPMD